MAIPNHAASNHTIRSDVMASCSVQPHHQKLQKVASPQVTTWFMKHYTTINVSRRHKTYVHFGPTRRTYFMWQLIFIFLITNNSQFIITGANVSEYMNWWWFGTKNLLPWCQQTFLHWRRLLSQWKVVFGSYTEPLLSALFFKSTSFESLHHIKNFLEYFLNLEASSLDFDQTFF